MMCSVIMTRDEIANDLIRECPLEALEDHGVIARAVRRGDDRAVILALPEVNNWPETYVWLALVLRREGR